MAAKYDVNINSLALGMWQGVSVQIVSDISHTTPIQFILVLSTFVKHILIPQNDFGMQVNLVNRHL